MNAPSPSKAFDGATYDPKRDWRRLDLQVSAVYRAMRLGVWLTLGQVGDWIFEEVQIDVPHQSISARIRDLRKPKWGGHEIQRRYLRDGIWQYRMVIPRKGAA